MAAPPLPPRPVEEHHPSLPPPLPPLPLDLRINDYSYESPPHFDHPLVAPRPHKLDPALPANMARNLDDQAYMFDYRRPSPAPPAPPPGAAINYTPGFALPASGPQRGPTPLPNPQGAAWAPWNPSAANYDQQSQSPPFPSSHPYQPSQPYNSPPPPQSYQQSYQSPPFQSPPPQSFQSPPPQSFQSPPPQSSPPQSYQSPPYNPNALSADLANLSFSSNHPPQNHRAPSLDSFKPPKAPSPPRQSGTPSLTAPLPTIPSLTAALSSVQSPTHDSALKIAWCRDVLFLVARAQQSASTDAPVGPVSISDPQLLALSQAAVPLVLQLASPTPMPSPMPAYVAEAIYLRATFAASGGYPDFVRQNPRSAFRDFEAAARGGYSAAWFRLGRDYENFNDVSHAKDCFERGVKLGVESCAYRMGMAHLMGQLGLPASPDLAIPLLHRAATLASTEVPQPAYVYGLLLLSEFSHVTINPTLFAPYIPQGSSPQQEARKHLERAAYLHFAPAQYKLGHAYEFAQAPFPFDALLSVQYYSLASQQGEIEADMALSKWFLCGAEGSFEKDESLAFTFAEKAARKGLPSAEFALGYYAEVGVGGPKDIQAAIRWYSRAAEHGNKDASERLAALSQPSPQALSRQEHDVITESKLVRTRTQAKQRSEAIAQPPQPLPGGAPARRPDGRQVIDNIRKSSLAFPGAGSPNLSPNPNPGPGLNPPAAQARVRLPSMPEHPQTQQAPQRPGPAPAAGAGPPSGSPQARPQQQQPGRPFANAHRYTLSDGPVPPGTGAGAGTGGTNIPAGRRPVGQGRTPSGSNTPEAPRPAPGKGPTTFAEMGFQSGKVEDKECVIM